jgi:hypothetical protein
MKYNFKLRIILAFAALIIVGGAYSATKWDHARNRGGFDVYYTAACLVRGNLSPHLYDEAELHANPQLKFADPDTVFARTASAHGISRVMLYIYPPTLADLMTPLTFLPPAGALIAWNLLNLAMIVLVSVVLMRLQGVRNPVLASLIAVLLLLFRPTLNCLYWGQVSILLLFLVVAGLSLYASGQKSLAGFMFALAAAIKLTPLIVIVPLIAWRDWKSLRAIAFWGAVILGTLWMVNGSGTLNLYFLHQLPSMSGGDLGGGDFSNNRSLGNIFYEYLRGSGHAAAPIWLAWAVRLVSALVLCLAGWLSLLRKDDMPADGQRLESFSIFLLLACCISPYSWLYAYVFCAPELVILGKRIWERRLNGAETALMMAFLISLSTSGLQMPMMTPLVGIALGIMGLCRLRAERRPEKSCDVATAEIPA